MFTLTECTHHAKSTGTNAVDALVFECWVLLCSGCQTWHDDCAARSRKNDAVFRWDDGVLREREWLKTRLTVSAQHVPASSPESRQTTCGEKGRDGPGCALPFRSLKAGGQQPVNQGKSSLWACYKLFTHTESGSTSIFSPLRGLRGRLVG